MRGRLDRLEEECAAARRERSTVRAADPFLPHGLEPDRVAAVRTALSAQPECGQAWLVRKELRHFPNRPLFVLCVRRRSARWWLGDPDRDRELVRRLTATVELPGQVLIVGSFGAFRALAARVRSIEGAEVFRCDSREPEPTGPVIDGIGESGDR
jgi:hypothetical protein